MTQQHDQAEAGVLMVGSIPLADATTVFNRLSTDLSGRLRSMPDGETGERDYFCRWQHQIFPSEVLTKREDVPRSNMPESNEPLKDRYTVESLKGTGYDGAALTSYAKFLELRKQGKISPNVRFQVCVPTPFGVCVGLCKHELIPQFEPLYEERLRQSLQRIVENISHEDLLVQWDLPFETLALECDRGAFTSKQLEMWFEPVLDGLLQRLTRATDAIPPSVPIGFHLCYGDIEHKHLYEPKDTSFMVELAHHLIRVLGSTHQIDYIHMPVPINRTDVGYFQALKDLRMPDHTCLCLGVVHPHDEAGTRKRIEVAKSVYPRPFSVATECGLGRTPSEDIDSIFDILSRVTNPID